MEKHSEDIFLDKVRAEIKYLREQYNLTHPLFTNKGTLFDFDMDTLRDCCLVLHQSPSEISDVKMYCELYDIELHDGWEKQCIN